MSITDELREWASSELSYKTRFDELIAIADRIDAAMDGMIELPKDAGGEYIHVGDVLTDDAEFRSEGEVVRLMLEGEDWFVGFDRRAGWAELSIHEWHHHHAQTVEDVLREFAEAMNENMGMYTGEAIDADEWRMADERTIAKYAAKLRLAEEDA